MRRHRGVVRVATLPFLPKTQDGDGRRGAPRDALPTGRREQRRREGLHEVRRIQRADHVPAARREAPEGACKQSAGAALGQRRVERRLVEDDVVGGARRGPAGRPVVDLAVPRVPVDAHDASEPDVGGEAPREIRRPAAEVDRARGRGVDAVEQARQQRFELRPFQKPLEGRLPRDRRRQPHLWLDEGAGRTDRAPVVDGAQRAVPLQQVRGVGVHRAADARQPELDGAPPRRFLQPGAEASPAHTRRDGERRQLQRVVVGYEQSHAHDGRAIEREQPLARAQVVPRARERREHVAVGGHGSRIARRGEFAQRFGVLRRVCRGEADDSSGC